MPQYLFNLGSEADGPAINAGSGGFAPSASEFQACQIASLRGSLVRSLRIASVGAALECEACEVVHLPPTPDGRQRRVVVGRVLGIDIADEDIKNALVDEPALRRLTRLKDGHQSTPGDSVEMNRPG